MWLLGPLQEQPVLLTIEPCPQSLIVSCFELRFLHLVSYFFVTIVLLDVRSLCYVLCLMLCVMSYVMSYVMCYVLCLMSYVCICLMCVMCYVCIPS